MSAAIQQAGTVGSLIDAIAEQLANAELHYGHGTNHPVDESAALIFHVLQLDHTEGSAAYAEEVSKSQRSQIIELLEQRIAMRQPLPYLLGEAWFAGLPFGVDERVLIPRSPIAELIVNRFQPWIDPGDVHQILEIGTGSGCIAITCALVFPDAQVVATDISSAALEVAAANAGRHGVSNRVELIETDHAEGLTGSFDLIVTNPPYVPSDEMAKLPSEYRHEPELALVSGVDGLDSARRILQDAPGLLSAQGALIIEVGAQWEALERAFPRLPFTWLDFEYGGEGVALLFRDNF
jgi:ribosomal protein L3 glutamine methyltransferase